jgi:hypothetical protein
MIADFIIERSWLGISQLHCTLEATPMETVAGILICARSQSTLFGKAKVQQNQGGSYCLQGRFLDEPQSKF